MRFKKVYIEITNKCNLNCSFCIGNERKKKFMTRDEFLIILNKLKRYTKYLYFHLMGEPLLHPDINEFINIASEDYYINITTNGYLIKRIENNKNIRQLNISLQDFDSKISSLDNYMDNIFKSVNILRNNGVIINYRIWGKNELKNKIKDILIKEYGSLNNHTLSKNVFFSEEEEFIWPSMSNSYYNDMGSCQGLVTHIGILVDGSIVPCCLDSAGVITLGNIFNDEIEHILNNDRVKTMIDGFKHNKKREKLCCKCNFYDRIIKNGK